MFLTYFNAKKNRKYEKMQINKIINKIIKK